MKKFFALIISVALAACCMGLLVSCDKSTAPTDKNYYLYDMESGSYNNNDYMSVSGNKCVIYTKNGKDGKGIKADGSFEITEENKFEAKSVYKINRLSDLLSDKELKDFEEESGIKNSEVTFDAQIDMTVTGRMYGNALKVYTQEAEISGFKGIFAFLNGSMTSGSDEVYCQKGSKPDFSVTLTYDLGGGTIGGKGSVKVKTDAEGKIVFPDAEPKRDGYKFLYYSTIEEEVRYDQAVSEDTVFDYDATLYAHWKQLHNVTFISNSVEYGFADNNQTVTVADGDVCPVPELIRLVETPTRRIKGWFVGDTQIFVGLTVIKQDCTVIAQWYTESEVAEYNNNLDWGSNNYLYVHISSQSRRSSSGLFAFADLYRVESDGTVREYGIDPTNESADISGCVFVFALTNHVYPTYDKDYDFLECSVKLVLKQCSYFDAAEIIIPKSMIPFGKPAHVFYNADTGVLSDKW